jgi:hypothetical protein
MVDSASVGMSKLVNSLGKLNICGSARATEKNAAMSMQIDCKVYPTQLVWGIVTNGIF